jgi:hypothetical protein
MRTNRNLEAIDRIADLSAKLADEAATIGLKSLVYILRMAEIEARQSTTPGVAPRKQTARTAGAA